MSGYNYLYYLKRTGDPVAIYESKVCVRDCPRYGITEIKCGGANSGEC